MQLFNQINARKIEKGENNVFSGMFNNWMFVAVLVLTLVIQVCMVELAGETAKCYPLNMQQNLWALLFGFIEIPFALILKQMPLKLFQCISLDEKPKDENKKSLKDRLKNNSTFTRKIQ